MCAIFGVLDYKGKLEPVQKLRIVKELGTAAEVRGTDAAGIAFFQRGRLSIQKAAKPAHKMKYRIPAEVRYIMGHTRMTTQGSAKVNQNNHPFPGRAGKQSFALAHNGVLHNEWELRQDFQLPEPSIETDSYVAVQMIEKQGEVSFGSLRKMAEALEGSFTITILDRDNNLYFVKGDNPLTIYHFPKLGLYLYASTEDILIAALKRLGMRLERMKHEAIQPWPGDILRIDSLGKQELSQFRMEEWLPPCSWYSPKRYGYQKERSRDGHIQALKMIAAFHGYEEEYIDALIRDGYTTDDLEDLIYQGRA